MNDKVYVIEYRRDELSDYWISKYYFKTLEEAEDYLYDADYTYTGEIDNTYKLSREGSVGYATIKELPMFKPFRLSTQYQW